ncbi:MAG TPA: glutathionylspermidine synthase family protein [Verrucomicrobiae bacterium]|nr:glutathionylspermidine synthase family protein [Verrucomicrobiae bacterium]
MTHSLPLARPSRASAFGQIPFAASQAAQVLVWRGEGESCRHVYGSGSQYASKVESERHGLRAGTVVDAAAFSEIRRRAVLEGCKWDPQVGDVSTLARFPLVMKASVWKRLAFQVEQLASEANLAEEEISRRPELLTELGLPSALRRVLAGEGPVTPSAGHVVRFDFHFTTDGWKISEANSDVPGGFAEGSYFTALMAEQFPQFRSVPNPGEIWSEALAAAAGSGVIALLSAPGYMEDHQVISFLAARLREKGCNAHLAKPEQISWRDGLAHLETAWYRGPVAVIVKFYQAEWLSRLPETCGWKYFFRGGKTRVANPASAIISESKRFPLVWDRLTVGLPTWRALLPETRDPREVPWQRDDGWLVKTAFCNTGDTVSVRSAMKPRDWWWTRLSVQLNPRQWVAQRRFESVPVQTPDGPRHVCVGIYTVNGRAAGAYTRLSTTPIIDYAAVDAALLLADDDE